MANNTTISVIIPAYNVEKYLDDCLKSVMLYNSSPFEVVLVNDGSNDRTAAVCEKWVKKYSNIVYIEQENKGQGAARNIAVARASGIWLVFLDADDTMQPGALDSLQYSVDHGCDVICYGSIFRSRTKDLLPPYIPPSTEDKHRIMRETSSVLWDKMIKKEFWQREKIELSDQYGEDIFPVYLMLAKARKVYSINIPLICHYDREDNLSSRPDKIIQIVQSVSETLRQFKEMELFEQYRDELFFMLEKQHRHYRGRWAINHFDEEKMIVEMLEAVSLQYFPKEYQKIFNIKEESLVLIGNISRPFPNIFENWNLYYYACLEQYLTDESRPINGICHFILNVENEIRSVKVRTRTEKWALSHWKMLCLELQEIRDENKMKGKIFLYAPRRHREELIVRFENVARSTWNCIRLDHLTDFWRMTGTPDCKNALKQNSVHEICMEPIEKMPINYRWEYMRLDYNINLLFSWLFLKQKNRKLEKYFRKHGYKKIAIYGIGYLGKLLIEELRDSSITISFLMDRDLDQKLEYPVYSLDSLLPDADVIVISVIHAFDEIREKLKYKCICPIISLQMVVDWCSAI